MNLAQHIQRFLEENKDKYNPASFEKRRIGLKYYLAFLKVQGQDTVHVDSSFIDRFREHLYLERHHHRTTAWLYARAVKDLYLYLKVRGVIEESPVKPYTFQKAPLKERHYTDPEIFRAYIENWKKIFSSPSRIRFLEEGTSKIRTLLTKHKVRLQSLDRLNLEGIAQDIDRYPTKIGTILRKEARERLFNLLESILRWMVHNGYRSDNPAKGFKYHFSLDREERIIPQTNLPEHWQNHLTKFLKEAEVRWRPRTIEAHYRYLKGFFKYLETLNIQDIQQITRGALEEYRYAIYHDHRYAQTTQWSKLAMVRHFMDYLERTEQILLNPARKMSWPKKTRGLPTRLMSEYDVKNLMQAPDLATPFGLRDRAIFEVMYSTGARVGEVGGIRLEDIDFGNGLLKIQVPKGGPDYQRVIPIGESALEWIKRYIDKARYYFPKRRAYEDLLFLTKTGGPVSGHSVSPAMRYYCAKQGMRKHYSSHSWRVTCATGMLRNRADIRHVQEQLGHRRLDSTKIYTRLFPMDLKKVHQKTHPKEKEYRRAVKNFT